MRAMIMMTSEGKYNILTYGCQMNVYDSEVLAGHLEGMGYRAAGDGEAADVLILNTCAVRKKAEDKVFSRLGMVRELKKNNPQMIVVLWGCMAQQKGMAALLKGRFKFIDLICGPNSLERFPELLERVRVRNFKKTLVDLEMSGERESFPVKRTEGVKAWVPISHGCNNFCSYCVVPYVRGPEISRKPENIIKEIEELINTGYKEITLLGQNVNSYGKDLHGEYSFAYLLRRLEGMADFLRIRFMTSHPRDFSPEIIRAIAESKNVCEHIHLPLQSGSDRILKDMNRGYTRDYYLGLIDKIREMIPESSITTDIIVGFPGEEEEDYNLTLEIMNKVRFDAAYTFVYSPRKGTKAAEMKNQISAEIKKKRITRLNTVQNQIVLEKNEPLVGSVQEILVEGMSKTDEQMYIGRTRTNKIVHFPLADNSSEDLTGKFVNIKIQEAGPWSLSGIIIN